MTASWAVQDTPGAACERLPLDDSTALFFPRPLGGRLARTKPWPAPDSHADARALCAVCPVLEGCLRDALAGDPTTFRGGLSPEERGAVGGCRDDITARRRPPTVTVEQVWSRVRDSTLDEARVERAVLAHSSRAARDSARAAT